MYGDIRSYSGFVIIKLFNFLNIFFILNVRKNLNSEKSESQMGLNPRPYVILSDALTTEQFSGIL